ncbi:hypothetical protein MJO28_002926 [Puccinia striiformis f. sp. tritici]|uniref:Uncharacterized protein n=1 Tax=Puccinia striiformis f. sp. tritici TaxID=168172 RepID=A0ACC0EUR1_9BASI|nr:hypothetical protein MJO28_002926 [Puccinia striiformis f. sp. tritici]
MAIKTAELAKSSNRAQALFSSDREPTEFGTSDNIVASGSEGDILVNEIGSYWIALSLFKDP